MKDLFKIQTQQIIKIDRPFLEMSNRELKMTLIMANNKISSSTFDSICGEHSKLIEELFKNDIALERALRN
jgi:hypothetical protein